ncbi:phosphoribosylformylglycinamidine synthase II [PVC group bacterium (ex Bugula neritina AB1)]|nr:phosphoribosylformylglycinamidine synthase II [PVC group bacterium (ex Bugula neritina AB1)]
MSESKEFAPMSADIIEQHGLSKQEYSLIVEKMHRDPNLLELGLFSVMWSEHCSYKNSKNLLKLFPTKHEKILVPAGEENAGIVDIGDDWAVAFKVESHNHPSALEPYQGAATGVGGIIRDIFTMGARPIACMNSLRFGSLEDKHVRFLLKGVVEGIAGYGNCVGVPTVGGEVMFDDSYQTNPLVNVFCLGLLKTDKIARGAASGAGNQVLYVGASTGRDGIHGATFASDDLTEDSQEERSAVQVGDPFMEKLLLEACLEVIQEDLVVGIQDMGAAGLTCAVCETAARGKMGISIDVSKVPQREKGMTPYEIMLSESQERMLLIVEKKYVDRVSEIFQKWDLHVKNIGQVESGDRMRIFENKNLVADVPVQALSDDAPVYTREERKPEYLSKIPLIDREKVNAMVDYGETLKKLLATPNIASKKMIYEQYDHMVQTNTVVRPGSDAAVIRIKNTNKFLAMKLDGQGRYCHADPYEGGKIAVAEAARNVVCAGARPIAGTDCLNFGNPMHEENFWVFHHCVKGLAKACSDLDIPIIGGNVSLYNQNVDGPIFPTPIVGVVGLIDNVQESEVAKRINSQFFQNEGDLILLLGENKNEIGSSEFSENILGEKLSLCPTLDLAVEKKLHEAVLLSSEKGLLNSAHDCSEGGLAVTLAESCMSAESASLGAKIVLPNEEEIPLNIILFGETQSRVVVSCDPSSLADIQDICLKNDTPVTVLGNVEGERLVIEDVLDLSVKELEHFWSDSLERTMNRS